MTQINPETPKTPKTPETPISDEQLVSMSQQYDITRRGDYVCHEAYDEINRQVQSGRPWAKCPNCGNPFPLDRPGASAELCSEKCAKEYLVYLTHSQYQF